MLPDSSERATLSPQVRQRDRAIAPLWHTGIVLFVVIGASLGGARGIHPAAGHNKLPQYFWTMAWEWALTGFVYLGIRKRVSLRELIGGRWEDGEAFLKDVIIAAVFWLVTMTILAAGARLMHFDQGAKIDSLRREVGFLVPSTTLELVVWCCLSITAGICEEIIFRGYLQRQFGIIARSTFAGVIASAIVFGAAHGYEGSQRMLLIAIFGLLLGLLAWWRKSLRPGMIAHAWHDALSGALLRLLK